MVMQDVFEKLRSLQDVLSKKFELQHEMAEIPKVLATRTELLNRMKKTYLDNSQEYKLKTQYIEELRKKAIEAESAREKFESQMDLIQTQREYEALDKEIKDSGEREQDIRKDLQKEEQLHAEMKIGLEKEEAMIRKQEEEVQKEQAKIKEALHERDKQIKSLERKEKLITPGLDEEILFKFERIIRSKSGLGIVPIEHGVCNGCHMILTVQFVNEVRKGEGIMFCPYCSRILFHQEESEGVSSLLFEEGVEEPMEEGEEIEYDEEEESGSEEEE
jgi:predicted  nucleic acid-binding Zn-ribbon protein